MDRQYNTGCTLEKGDRVVCLADDKNGYIGDGASNLVGATGTVDHIYENGAIGVVFDKLILPRWHWTFDTGKGLYFHNADRSLELTREEISKEDFLIIFK